MASFSVAVAALVSSLCISHAWTPRPVSTLIPRSIQSAQYCRYQRPNSKGLCSSSSSSSSSSTEPPQSYGDILLFNSKSRAKEPFSPLEEGKVSMYTCGPTVYDSAHVGNFRAFLTYDVLKRVLTYFGLNVHHICNLTDIDDKIIARCLRDNVDLMTLTTKYEQAFMDDLSKLNIVPASRYPRATLHIQDMVEMIQSLETNGLAYQTSDGSWYFDTQQQPGYGQQLVQLSPDEMERTVDRNEADEKRSFQDFCLWKAAKDGEPADTVWDTSIGRGRPGWHLECSAMAKRYLGDTIDVHCGGIDLKFPHHENEIAQSTGASGTNFCNCWIHNGFVNIGNEKMSKSMGNFLTLGEACPKPMDVRAYRYLVVSSHYRTDLSFTEQAMNGAKKALQRMDKVRTRVQDTLAQYEDEGFNDSEIANTVVPAQIENFEAALKDDLSMPSAAACLFALIKVAETELKQIDHPDVIGLRAIIDALDQMDQVFGVFYTVPGAEDEPHDTTVPEEVMELVGQRTAAKEAKDWELADSLRSRITELGFMVKDVKGGEPIVSPVES